MVLCQVSFLGLPVPSSVVAELANGQPIQTIRGYPLLCCVREAETGLYGDAILMLPHRSFILTITYYGGGVTTSPSAVQMPFTVPKGLAQHTVLVNKELSPKALKALKNPLRLPSTPPPPPKQTQSTRWDLDYEGDD